ncbi:MAG: DUF3800 domain-containing protein [Anaerolineae bacterium]
MDYTPYRTRNQPYRYALGDEAGDTGFRFEQGSTTFFLYSILLVDDLQPLRDYVDEMRIKLRMTNLAEFRFHNSSNTHRRAFLDGLQFLNFEVRALAVNKSKLPLQFHGVGKLGFFAFVLNDLIQRISADELSQTNLILDQFNGAEETVRLLRKLLRFSGQPGRFARIATKRSRSENALQVADMVAGAMLRSLRTGDRSWYGPIWERVLLWEYGQNKNPPR